MKFIFLNHNTQRNSRYPHPEKSIELLQTFQPMLNDPDYCRGAALSLK
jgi:hypothetical protein